MPLANRRDGTELLITRYLRFNEKFLTGDDEPVKQYRKKIFGPAADLIAYMPFRLHELFIAAEKMPINEWDALPANTKAEILASERIKNMRETLSRHLEIQAMERERRSGNKGT